MEPSLWGSGIYLALFCVNARTEEGNKRKSMTENSWLLHEPTVNLHPTEVGLP